MLTASQLDVNASASITEAGRESSNSNAIAETLTSARADDDLPDVDALRPWLASLDITRPEPRIGMLARRLAVAARRMAARG